MRFPRLFEAIRIGSRTAKNRVMRLATVTNLAESSRIGERMIVHYRTVAEGGAGTIVIEALRVHASDAGRPTFVTLFDPAVVRMPRVVSTSIAEFLWNRVNRSMTTEAAVSPLPTTQTFSARSR